MVPLARIFIVFNFMQISIAQFDPEAYMNATDMIRHWGYPVEIYDVTTADGFILSMFRIRHGRDSEENISCHRPVVLFVHGLGADSTEFYVNPPESSPAFILADAGFDVFLANFRGTTYSKRHRTLKHTDNKFWQWTIDEFAKYDCPAVIDKALEISGEKGVYWIGHSMGTSLGYMTLSESPQYNSKIKSLFMLAPSGSTGYWQGPLKKIFNKIYIAFKPIVHFIRNTLGSHEIGVGRPSIYRPLSNLCNFIPGAKEFCTKAIQKLVGPSAKPLNISRVAVYSSHFPSGTSTWSLLHLLQASISMHRKVVHFDLGPTENVKQYGKESPPPYDYSVITVPVYHFWSRNDILSTREDIDKTIIEAGLKEDIVKWIKVPEYNHGDFTLAIDCAEKIFNPIAEIVRGQETDMCRR